MELFDELVIFKISQYLSKDLENTLCVCKSWHTIFKTHMNILKPTYTDAEKYNILLKQLKLGYKYDLTKVLYNIIKLLPLLNNKKRKKLISSIQLKYALDKPNINYIPLYKFNLVYNELNIMKLI